MKQIFTAICVLALLSLIGFAVTTRGQCRVVPEESQGALAPSAPPSVDAQLEKMTVADLGRDHLRLALSLALLSRNDLTVRQITFENLRVNGIPFYAAPLTDRLQLPAKQRFEMPQPLQLTLYYRDTDSLKPLTELVEQSKAHVEGTLYLDVELRALQKFFLMTGKAHVPVSFAMDVPVEIPGGALARSGAVRVLAAADIALQSAKDKADSILNVGLRWRGQLSREYAPAMLLAQTRFMLSGPHAEQVVFACTGPGFRVAPRKFILLKELVEPWKFDPEMAAAIKDDHFKVAPGSNDLLVWSADQPPGKDGALPDALARKSQDQIRVVTEPPDDEDTVLVPRAEGHPKKVRVHRRESAANLVLLEFTSAVSGSTSKGMQSSATDQKASWESVAVYRFPGGTERKQLHPDLIFVPVTKENARLKLAASVDGSAWGAPLISPQGLIGVLQSESSGLTWEDIQRALSLTSATP
jgi:hypothetical protein